MSKIKESNGVTEIKAVKDAKGSKQSNAIKDLKGVKELKKINVTNGVTVSNGVKELNGTKQNGTKENGIKENGIKENGVKENRINELNGTNDHLDADLLPPPLLLKDASKARQIESVLSPLKLNWATLKQVSDVFTDEMERGLRKEPSSLQMENTYVPDVPDGTEEGLYLALDLGGTNFRLLLLEIKGGELIRQDVKHYHVNDHLRLGSGLELFDFLADCVADFVKSERLEDVSLPLGFTFSFPMVQYNLASGSLVTWTKSFKCSGMEDQDVVQMLRTSLDKRGIHNVYIVALLNDTTGTLVAGAKLDHRTGIGVIIGTGSNGCYIEKAEKVYSHPRYPSGKQMTSNGNLIPSSPLGEVIVDIEWGAFGDDGCLDFIKTEVNKVVDEDSLLANSFTFEKNIGGKYLGAVVRAALEMLKKKGLFNPLPPKGHITTAHISLFENDADNRSTKETIETLCELCVDDVTVSIEDALIVQYVCGVISNRAAQLVSVCIANLIVRMRREHNVVAVDGSVFRHHPRLKHLMEKYIKMLAPGHKFSFILAEDGSGKGAALTASVAKRLMDAANRKKNGPKIKPIVKS